MAQPPWGGQAGQAPPPQSTSVSLPFIMWSVHDGTSHTPPVQVPLEQSVATRQLLPSPQGPQAGPPQSTSVSVPSLLALAQPAVWHSPAEHVPPMQSVPARQAFPFPQRSQVPVPPQSMSVSTPSFRWSTQVGAPVVPGPSLGLASASGAPLSARGTPPSAASGVPLVRE